MYIMSLCKTIYLRKYAIKRNNLKLMKVSRDRSFAATKSKETRKGFWHNRTLAIA